MQLGEGIARNSPFGSAAPDHRGGAPNPPARSAGRKHCSTEPPRSIASPVQAAAQLLQRVKVSVLAPLVQRRHSRSQIRRTPFDPVSRIPGIRQRAQWPVAQLSSSRNDMCALTTRCSGRVQHQVPSSCARVRAAELSRSPTEGVAMTSQRCVI